MFLNARKYTFKKCTCQIKSFTLKYISNHCFSNLVWRFKEVHLLYVAKHTLKYLIIILTIVLFDNIQVNVFKCTKWQLQMCNPVYMHTFQMNSVCTYIYIYAFSRRFYPKQLTLHSSYSFYILSALAFPGNRTHDLGVANAMLYQLSYRKA